MASAGRPREGAPRRGPGPHPAGRHHDLDGGPALADLAGQFEPAQSRRHLGIREKHLNVGTRLQHLQGLRGIPRLNDLEALVLQGIRYQHPDQNLVLHNQD